MNPTLFLLLALTACWTRLVQSEDNEKPELLDEENLTVEVKTSKAEETDENTEIHGDEAGSGDGRSQVTDTNLGFTPNSESESESPNNEVPTAEAETDQDQDDLNTVIMIIIPLVLTIVIVSVIVCVVIIYRRRRIKDDMKEDAYLDDDVSEKVPMPMFEDDIPSVMELEMEDLENWMVKDGGKNVDTGQI